MGNVILLPVEVIARTASHLTPCRKTGKPHQGLSRGGDPMPLPLQNARKPLLGILKLDARNEIQPDLHGNAGVRRRISIEQPSHRLNSRSSHSARTPEHTGAMFGRDIALDASIVVPVVRSRKRMTFHLRIRCASFNANVSKPSVRAVIQQNHDHPSFE